MSESIAKVFLTWGDPARKLMSAFLASVCLSVGIDNPDIVERSIEEFEYALMFKSMGFPNTQDFKIKTHSSVVPVRPRPPRFPLEARNTITICNDENPGIQASSELRKHPYWFPIHPSLTQTGEHIVLPGFLRIVDSWRGVRS